MSPTPGQIAYEAWQGTYYQGTAVLAAVPWAVCSADYQRAWEVAAQAVLAGFHAQLAHAWAEGQAVLRRTGERKGRRRVVVVETDEPVNGAP